jgi:hypothetical protein
MDPEDIGAILNRVDPEKLEAVRIDVQLDAAYAITLCGYLQLALRHPAVNSGAAFPVRRFVDHCISVFEHAGLTECAQLIRLGYDSDFDGPV